MEFNMNHIPTKDKLEIIDDSSLLAIYSYRSQFNCEGYLKKIRGHSF